MDTVSCTVYMLILKPPEMINKWLKELVNYKDIDENAEIAPDLDDDKFVKSREAILRLLPRIFPKKSSRFSDLDILEHFIDETVEEIARLWIN